MNNDIQVLQDELDRANEELSNLVDDSGEVSSEVWELEGHIDDLTSEIQMLTTSLC